MTLHSEYSFLLDGGTPIVAKTAETGEDRYLIVDTMQDGQVYAVSSQKVDELIRADRLHVLA